MEDKIRISPIDVKIGRSVMARIQRDTDFVTGIIEIVNRAGYKTAMLQMAIGSLRKGEISWCIASTKTKRGSERTPVMPVEGPIELISAQGIICLADTERPVVHIHGVLCDCNGKSWGGHFFKGGNPVHSTMDVIITEIVGSVMSYEYDKELDFELAISKPEKEKEK